MMFWMLFLSYVLLSSCGLLLIKLGGSGTALSLTRQGFSMQMDVRLVVGLLCYIISFLLFTVVLQKKNLSVIYPLSAGIVNIISVILGIVVLKEKVTMAGMLGVLCIILGVVLLNIKG